MHIRDGLIDPKHVRAIGDEAIWLYLYLHKVCAQKTGLIRHYEHHQAATALGVSDRTIKRYMDRLKAGGYVDVTRAHNHLVVQITRYDWQEGRPAYRTEPPPEMPEVAPLPSDEMPDMSLLSPTEMPDMSLHSGERSDTSGIEKCQKALARSIYTSSINKDVGTTTHVVGTAPARNEPYELAEALILAQGCPAPRTVVLRSIESAKADVLDAYAGRATIDDALACLAYLVTDPWYQNNATSLTPRHLAKKLGPWLKNRPRVWHEPAQRNGHDQGAASPGEEAATVARAAFRAERLKRKAEEVRALGRAGTQEQGR